MSNDIDNLRALSIRELLWGMTFFLLPPLGILIWVSSSPEGYFLTAMLGVPVFVLVFLSSPIGVSVGESASPNYSNFTRAVTFSISGLVFCLGFGAIVLFGPIFAIVYAILGPIFVPLVVSKLKNVL